MNLIKLLDIANPKKIKDTLNLLITTYDGFDDEIRNIAKAAQKDASDALNNSETALSTVNTANANASAAKQTSEEALTMIEAADQRSEEATQTAETALDNANTATQTAELAMNLATQAKSTVDQAISTGVFGTFVHNPAGISLLHAYLTNNINQEDTAENTYVATPTLVKNALEAYLPLAGGQLTGALKIARGFQNGLLDNDDTDILYIDNNGNLCIGYGTIGKTKLTSNRIDVESNDFYVKHNFYVENGSAKFQYNGKSVAVKDDIPKTLNNKTLVANGNTTIYGTDIKLSSDNTSNVTDAINGKADTSAIPTKTSQLTNDSGFATTGDLGNYLPLTGGIMNGALIMNSENPLRFLHSQGYLSRYAIELYGDYTADDSGIYFRAGEVNGSNEINSVKKQFRMINDNGILYSGGSAYTNQVATKGDIPTKTSQLTNDSNFATTSQIPDISGKANLSGGNTFSGTQTFNNGLTLANDTAITNASGNNVITTQTGGHTILGDPNGITNIQGSTIRPVYTKKDSGSQTLALYKDIPNYFTTAGATGGNISGGLKLTAGHLYRIYVGMGDAILSCLVKMPIPMVEQYWFWGMNLYGHYCRLHISSAGVVTYQYANIGQNNWTNNNSVYITYEDITSKS